MEEFYVVSGVSLVVKLYFIVEDGDGEEEGDEVYEIYKIVICFYGVEEKIKIKLFYMFLWEYVCCCWCNSGEEEVVM